jgi:hypothetical protein
MKNLFLFFLFFGLVITACSDNSDDEIKLKPHYKGNKTAVDPTISTDFNSNTFTFGGEEDLLKELHLCDPKATSDSDPKHPSCSPKFFRFFKLTEQRDLKDGFIVLIKAGVNGFPLRRTLIFERENGQLVKVNGFNGNIIERRKSSSGYDDLIIRFPDNIEGNVTYYNCLFKWKENKYEYIHCEEIDEDIPRKIKAEFIDSMGIEIKKILDKNNMLF